MIVTKQKINKKQENAIIALLSESTIEQAARAAGIGEATLHRWLNNDLFSEAYRQARRRAFDSAISRLQKIAADAVNTLRDVAVDIDAPASSRVTAAKAVLEMAIKSIELQDLENRIIALENKMHGGEN